MENLAGNRHSDIYIKEELTRCGIPVVKICDKPSGEPGYTFGGKLNTKLGEITFERAWYYYIVKGKVPLDIAKKLYENPVGKTDIRLDGDCGCPPPELPWITFEDKNGIHLVSDRDISEIKEVSKTEPRYLDFLKIYKCIDEVPESDRIGYADLYHIDSELGLYIFVQTLKNEGFLKN